MDAAADPKVEGPGGRKFSFVWLAPLIAVAVALFLLWREYEAQGPLIEIAFPAAEGMREGETALRYRDVDVGRVETLRFSGDLSRVVAEVRLEPSIAPFIDNGAEFWLVRPEVSARGISGLETVLSGVYIEGSWDADAGAAQRRFDALDQPPLTPIGAPGKRVTLRASEGGSLSVGAPILFRGIEVGRVEARRLTDDGTAVEFDIFVNAPNDRRLTRDTRFWNASGVELSFGADGARLNIASLAALVQGGASFEDLSGGAAEPVAPGFVYNLYPSEDDARAQALDVEPGEQLLLDVYFNGSIRGLSVGA
ncbi:MAG: MlaD family protein, partial [Pseudomonadota bacterium]